jgi:hypothetical protein
VNFAVVTQLNVWRYTAVKPDFSSTDQKLQYDDLVIKEKTSECTSSISSFHLT